MSTLKDPISRRSALALGSSLAGSLAAAAAVEGEPNTPDAQVSASPDPAPANNGQVTPDTTGQGGELHRNAGGSFSSMTTDQGLPIADDENSLKVGNAARCCSKISCFGRRSITLIMNAFRSG